MSVLELNLPARFAAGTQFKKVYGATHFAADQLQHLATEDGRLKDNAGSTDTKMLLVSLQEALCAARELDNILAGNPLPRRGE